ncbi:MAG TPA: class I SAM-dependent methyltransferase [Gammaproteobacteria bacterium]|nr:class I SAM-dependent methyltransferase [Gammaproteobacteria bacterium]
MDNYDYCAQWVLDQHPAAGACALDYGCGAGHIVSRLRARGVEAYGCDVFYEGGDYSGQVQQAYFASRIVRRIENGRIPFDDASFDFVTSNQVFEHVADLGAVLAEIARVLKPGGRLLCLFPDRGVWREGHCGVPFLHWFPKRSRPRVRYAMLMRRLGFGYFTESRSVRQWSESFCTWLDDWTHYRSRAEIDHLFARHFGPPRPREDEWLARRLEARRLPLMLVPRALQRLVVRKLAGLVFEVEKPLPLATAAADRSPGVAQRNPGSLPD